MNQLKDFNFNPVEIEFICRIYNNFSWGSSGGPVASLENYNYIVVSGLIKTMNRFKEKKYDITKLSPAGKVVFDKIFNTITKKPVYSLLVKGEKYE